MGIWHSRENGLHSEGWHVGEVTGNPAERELSDEEYKAVLNSMVKEGWDEDDADEWLASFCIDAKEIVENRSENVPRPS